MTAYATATVRVLSAEEIAARAGGTTPPFVWPQGASVFSERAMRLRQLAAGHAMGDFLSFMSALALAQQQALDAMSSGPAWPLPDAAAIDRAAQEGRPPLPATDWPRDPRWHEVLRGIVAQLAPAAPAGPAREAMDRLAAADDVWLERQADALLTGVMAGLDLATAPVVAASLQVLWTHLAIGIEQRHARRGERHTQAIGRLDDRGVCPCCGSRPVASITRSAGESTGQRYLHCGLCNLQWHLERGRCSHCGASEHVAYQSLDLADAAPGSDESGQRAARAVIQAETCDDCGHYLKIMHSDRDPFVDPVADDLASLTLDLLVAETDRQRHGVNLLLLFGDPGEVDAVPPDPAAV
jgi:FdhE protein